MTRGRNQRSRATATDATVEEGAQSAAVLDPGNAEARAIDGEVLPPAARADSAIKNCAGMGWPHPELDALEAELNAAIGVLDGMLRAAEPQAITIGHDALDGLRAIRARFTVEAAP